MKGSKARSREDWFRELAVGTAHWAGKPLTFLIMVAVIAAWALSGPIFGFSDTWQLIINTSTTIVTFLMVFLMVFLIQNTQNRDALALQLKLSELIIAVHGARNQIAEIEDFSDEQLEGLRRELHERAERTVEQVRQASAHRRHHRHRSHGRHREHEHPGSDA